jgi:hypothetical protein
MQKPFDCKVLGKSVVITCTPGKVAAREDREWERNSAGLILRYDCSGRTECLRRPSSAWCCFTREDAKAMRCEWLKQK